MFARSSDWLAATLSAETLITTLSCGVEQSTGYSPQELVGRPITDILADASVFEVPQILDRARESGCWEGKLIHTTREGRLIHARSMVSLLSGTERRVNEYLLMSDLNGCLDLDGNENPALADVAANLRTFAHELNNPLAVVMGFTQILVSESNCPGRIRADIEKIYSELKRVVQVVERMHGYALSVYERQEKNSLQQTAIRHA